jgi:hypothetical protein
MFEQQGQNLCGLFLELDPDPVFPQLSGAGLELKSAKSVPLNHG